MIFPKLYEYYMYKNRKYVRFFKRLLATLALILMHSLHIHGNTCGHKPQPSLVRICKGVVLLYWNIRTMQDLTFYHKRFGLHAVWLLWLRHSFRPYISSLSIEIRCIVVVWHFSLFNYKRQAVIQVRRASITDGASS